MAKRKKKKSSRLGTSARDERVKRFSIPLLSAHGSILLDAVEKGLMADPVLRAKVRQTQKYAWNLVNERMMNGTGLLCSNEVRSYLLEYARRLWHVGPFAFPSSFNVVEAFFSFDEEFHFFDLRPEREYLLAANEYFDWYTDRDNHSVTSTRIIVDNLAEVSAAE